MFLQKIEGSPTALLVKVKHHRKILFLLGEKEIRRVQKVKELLEEAKRKVEEMIEKGGDRNEKISTS